MTSKEIDRTRSKWLKDVKYIDNEIKAKAGKHFFNPFRRGIYYYQIQGIFLLGANKWHPLIDILKKMEEVMSDIPYIKKSRDGHIIENSNVWDKFRNKTERSDATRCKSHIGRIQENMFFFQRLNKLHPCGYKLRQVFSAIDIKKESHEIIPNGIFFYRLSTYEDFDSALPIRDFRKFIFPVKSGKYINKKFIGKIITKDKILVSGVEV